MITEVYIQGRKLDLFNDESINVTQSAQDVNDISKVFGDYSQTFSVPASRNNNAIFKFYYNADIDNGFDARLRVKGSISVNTLDFKIGKIRLDGAEIKDNKPTSYKITFFGNIVNIKDLIDDDELKDLLWLNNFSRDYDGDLVKEGLTNGLDYTVDSQTYNEAVVFPLISYKRQYFYNSNPSDNTSTDQLVNIAYNASRNDGVDSRNLKPAIKLFLIVKAIEEQYGFNFNSAFFNSALFKSIYINLNKETESLSAGLKVYEELSGTFTPPQGVGYEYRYVTTVRPKAGFEDVPYKINLYFNNQQVVGTVFITGDQSRWQGNLDFTEEWNVKAEVVTQESFEFDATTRLEYKSLAGFYVFGGNVFNNSYNNQVIDLVMNIIELLPEIKVYDILTSLFKTFNLTAVADGEDINIEDLQSWYSSGEIYDVTKFIDLKKETVNRGKIYREINFKFEESEQILAEEYKQSNNLAYGDLEFKLTDENGQDLESVDGDVLDIECIFENPIHERLIDLNDNSNINIQYTPYFNREIEAISGNAFMFYADKTIITANTLGFLNDGVYEEIYSAFMPSHSYVINENTFNLNFNAEVNEFTNGIMPNTIYKRYYDDYITDIFSIKRRNYKYKAILPDYLLSNLKLNDRLIIKDRRYLINKISSNLVDREDTLELINDIYDAPLASDTLNTSMFRTAVDILSGAAINFNAEYIGFINQNISVVDNGFGTSFITLDKSKTDATVTSIGYTLTANATGAIRSVIIQVNDKVNDPKYVVFQEPNVVTADNNIITADTNLITADNG